MIAEAGLAALWLAFALALLQLGLGVAGLTGGRDVLLQAVRPVAVVQGLLTVVAFALLIWLFLRSDMSVELVALNSHSDKPWLYKFAGTWGNHEGSMLLWVAVLAFAGAAVALFERRLDERTLMATLAAQALVAAHHAIDGRLRERQVEMDAEAFGPDPHDPPRHTQRARFDHDMVADLWWTVAMRQRACHR